MKTDEMKGILADHDVEHQAVIDRTGHTPAGTGYFDIYDSCPFCDTHRLHRHFLISTSMPLKRR